MLQTCIEILRENNDRLKNQPQNAASTKAKCHKKGCTPFSSLVINPDKADEIMKLLHKYIKGKKYAKAIMKPIRAAVDAGVIDKPTWGQFRAEFGDDWVKSKFSLQKYLSDGYVFDDESFNQMKKKFMEIGI